MAPLLEGTALRAWSLAELLILDKLFNIPKSTECKRGITVQEHSITRSIGGETEMRAQAQRFLNWAAHESPGKL